MKKFALGLMGALLCIAPALAKNRLQHDSNATNTDVILHAWSWHLDTIAANMANISRAGYTIVQTSPVQQCFDPTGVNITLFDSDEKTGNWYYYYQPTDWKIGNSIVGGEASMQACLDSAAKYGVRIIVDVLPNHTAFDVDAVSPDFYRAVGGRDKMFHTKGLTPINDYNDRYQCSLQGTGGLPDVNTENPDFQRYYLQFVNRLLKMGVRGFRYDTAKHIGVHSDPVDKDAGVKVNDFWDVVTGRKAVKGVKLALPCDSLFIYGEVLQDRNVPEREYADYMGMTASGYGHVLRQVLDKRTAKGIDIKGWYHDVAPEFLTSWVESHDTYCNAHESAHLTDAQIRTAWVFLTARQNGIPLFYSRPAGSSVKNVWGINRAGARGNAEFMHPEVVAVNHFRRQMNGQKEDIQINDTGDVLVVNRGNKGAAVVNISSHANFVNIPTSLPSGTYHDVVYNQVFKVSKGRLVGIAAADRSYILLKK